MKLGVIEHIQSAGADGRTPMRGRKRFQKGDLVRMTKQAVLNGVSTTRETGIVAATPHRSDALFVSVRLWGHRTASRYHVDFWNHKR